jgi:hypothetical protein
MQDDPISILKKRLTIGEISVYEYNKLSAVLVEGNRQKASTSTLDKPPLQDKPVVTIDENNWFGNLAFAHKSNIHQVDKIRALRSTQYTQKINFAPIYHSGFEVTLSDGEIFEYKGTSVIIKTKKVGKLNEAFAFISKQTFSQRAYQYMGQINDSGCFQYRDYFIYANGDIKHKAKTVNIAEAALLNNVEFGRKSSFGLNSRYTPDEIWIYQKVPGKFLKQHICVKTKENRDVIYAILTKMAESKGGKVTFVER